MLVSILLLVVGFIILIKAADIFVDSASDTALHFKLSKMVIGLTIVAFGTSAPEFAVSMQSLINDSGDLVLGNVIGSNIINTLLILSIACMIKPIKVKSNTVKKEIPIYMLLSFVLSVLFFDVVFNLETINMISRSDGIVIVLFFIIFIYYLISIMRNRPSEQELPKNSMFKSIVFMILGIIAIVVSSDLVVAQAINIANYLNISERMISLTVIALGTSLPELVTSISAARKGEQDILIGNIIGSNIFNICVVLGIPVALFGNIIPNAFQVVDFIIMLLSSIVLFLFARKGYVLNKVEGFIMFIIFIIYYGYIIFF